MFDDGLQHSLHLGVGESVGQLLHFENAGVDGRQQPILQEMTTVGVCSLKGRLQRDDELLEIGMHLFQFGITVENVENRHETSLDQGQVVIWVFGKTYRSHHLHNERQVLMDLGIREVLHLLR